MSSKTIFTPARPGSGVAERGPEEVVVLAVASREPGEAAGASRRSEVSVYSELSVFRLVLLCADSVSVPFLCTLLSFSGEGILAERRRFVHGV